jgi:flavin-dependent dehydrogenase
MSIRLKNGSRICIVGGGPAGSFSALHLLKLAEEHGRQLEVLLFESRDASRPGRESCKGCAGILSAGLVSSLASFGITLPPEVIQAELRAYVVHVHGQVTSIEQPDLRRRILSVYRGAGPRQREGHPLAGFDGYLLSQACQHGAQLIPNRVRQVEWDRGPVVHTALESYRADLVVLATGVNSRPPLNPAFGYESPTTLTMSQDETWRPNNWPDYKVAGFFGHPPEGLAFGAIIPKGRYLNVSLLGQGQATEVVPNFYKAWQSALGRFFPNTPESLCSCTPRIAVRPAKTYFGDRWVAVGDAGVSRLYKDGIYSAFLTSGAAMRTAIEEGVSKQDFERDYAPFCRRLANDNVYGELLLNLSLLAMRNPLVARACIECVRSESSLPLNQRIYSRVMWGMLTGDDSYRDLFWLALKPRGMWNLAGQLIQTVKRRPDKNDSDQL